MTDDADQDRGYSKPRYGAYVEGDHEEIAVYVKATDFNGSDFDGWPFSTAPEWLKEALKRKVVDMNMERHADYADWTVETYLGPIVAEPGDYIVRRSDGQLSVVDEESAFILINLNPPAKGSEDR